MRRRLSNLDPRQLQRRLRRRADNRALLAAAALLPSPEHWLIDQFYGEGRTYDDIGAELERPPHVVRRRVQRLVRRLRNPCFILARQFARKLPEPLNVLALAHFCHGLTLGQCAARLRLTPHRTRRMSAVARAMLTAEAARKYGRGDPNAEALIVGLLGRNPKCEMQNA